MFYIVSIIYGIITLIFINASSGKSRKEQEKLFLWYLPVLLIYIVIMVLNGWFGPGTETPFVDY